MNLTAARQVQPAVPAARAQQGPEEEQAVVEGPFESASLNAGGQMGGALSGSVSGPTIMDKIREEEAKKKEEASMIFESASLRAEERAIRNGTAQPVGGALSANITFDSVASAERGSFGQATAYQLQQAAYVAAGNSQAPGKLPPYAAPQAAGPGGMSSYKPGGPGSPALAAQSSAPAFAAQPGAPAMAVPPVGGPQPAMGPSANPLLGGG